MFAKMVSIFSLDCYPFHFLMAFFYFNGYRLLIWIFINFIHFSFGKSHFRSRKLFREFFISIWKKNALLHKVSPKLWPVDIWPAFFYFNRYRLLIWKFINFIHFSIVKSHFRSRKLFREFFISIWNKTGFSKFSIDIDF